jgi:FixJ family two-component response regulator/predicted regulator of Ras-like GTPase activity (Roadblock/LC7/MglB family)
VTLIICRDAIEAHEEEATMASEPLANILVVDDSEAICKALRDVLTMSGYTVRTAPSGERALQILDTAQMDLVISDLRMSGISGLQLLKKIKEKSPSLPVVILTGFGDMDSVIEAMRSGVADYLKKPFAVSEVLQVTERELKRSKQMQAAAAATARATTVSTSPFAATEKPPRIFIFSAKDIEQIDSVLSALRAETMAESVLLIEETGYVISSKGMLNDTDLPALSALVVGSRSTTTQLASLLGESGSFALNYLEGLRVSVYTAGISQGLFLVVVVPKTVKQGAVWVYAKKAVSGIEKLVAGAVQQATSAAPAMEGSLQLDTAAIREEMSGKLDNLFSGEAVSAGATLADSVQTLTFEEAMARGLLGDFNAPNQP